jgi:hypothetical protein
MYVGVRKANRRQQNSPRVVASGGVTSGLDLGDRKSKYCALDGRRLLEGGGRAHRPDCGRGWWRRGSDWSIRPERLLELDENLITALKALMR